MSEHTKIIRGVLDISNEGLIQIANEFSNKFDELRERALEVALNDNIIEEVAYESLEATEDFKEFMEELIPGILDCEIRFISVPLLVDHFLRETNHYINFLQIYENEI